MSGKYSTWASTALPEWIERRYPRTMVTAMKKLVEANVLEWRITGTTHLAIRPIGKIDSVPLLLTCGKTAANPVYAAKWRSALRRWGLAPSNKELKHL